MSSDVASSSTGGPVILSPDLPTVEEVKGYNAEELEIFLKGRLNKIDNHIETLKAQKVDGEAFLDLTPDSLKAYGIPLGATSKIVKLFNEIQRGIGSLTAGIAGLDLQDVSNNIELNQVEEAFQIKYQGTTLDIFYSWLKSFHDEWYKHSKPYAPYLTIIQNSGSGKTRLVGELRTKGIYVLYICKRHESSTGYPASTPHVQKILEAIQNGKFKTLLSLAIKQIKVNNWSEDEFWSIQIKAEHKTLCAKFWDSIFKSLVQNEFSLDCNSETFVTNLFPSRDICVVCCIDEAHELLEKVHSDGETYFIRWRRQIRNISWRRFFSILLSTNGKIGNFFPPVTKDTISARSLDFEVFPAYLDVNTMDALASLAGNANKDYDPGRTAYLGIPLWGSLAQTGVSLMHLIHLASQKIRDFSKNDKDYLANLACTACSLALEVSPRIAEVDSLA